MDKKKYIDVLTEQASKHHRPLEMALSDFCDYLSVLILLRLAQLVSIFLNCTQKIPLLPILLFCGSTT